MSSSVGSNSPQRSLLYASRSQSEVVGVVLVFGMVVIGAFAVVALGATAVGDTESKLSEDRAEKTLTQLDSKAGLVALGESDSQRVSLPSGSSDEFSVNENEGKLTVDVKHRNNNTRVDWLDGEPLTEVDLGVIEFKNENAKLAYQGGGVFRTGDGNSTMISPPEFHYRQGTLTLPIINITGERSLGPSASISHSNESKVFPLPGSVNRSNPLENAEVEVTVQSEYYEGWGQYFDQRTDGAVRYDHNEESVTLLLRTPAGEQVVENAVSGTSSDGDFVLAGSGAGPGDVIADSYNSSSGTYDTTRSDSGNISVAGDFDLTGNEKTVEGTIETGGHFECDNNIEVTGDVFYETEDIHQGCNIHGDKFDTGDVDGLAPINDLVNDTVAELEDDNNNAGTPAEGGSLSYTAGTATLEAGDYYLDSLEVGNGETLTLDTQDQELRIGVEDYVELDGTATIEVEGDGKVEIYIKGEDTVNDNHFDMTAGGSDYGTVTTSGPRENSSNFWIYGKDDMQAEIADNQVNAHFEGVIYAPTDNLGDSKVEIEGARVPAGVVAGQVEINQGQSGAIHFDEALEGEQAIPEDTKIATINFLHITENEIAID